MLGTQDRDEFYEQNNEEFENTGKISRQVRTVRGFLITPAGRIYTPRRSAIKNENPGLYDKSVGGHVISNASFDITLTIEAKEELGIASVVVRSEEFLDVVRTRDLHEVAVFRQIDYLSPFDSIRITKDGKRFVQPLMNAFYLGYFDGPIKFEDGENDGLQVYSLDNLRKEIAATNNFTDDLKFMVEQYGHLILPLKK